jgi:Primase C terminal 2 (PriCT-2)
MSDTSDNGNGGLPDTVTDELRKVVSQIDPNCPYKAWFQIGCALHSEFGDGGFHVFNEWSATATKPGHYDTGAGANGSIAAATRPMPRGRSIIGGGNARPPAISRRSANARKGRS